MGTPEQKTILLVDDEALIAHSQAMIFKKEGYHVITVYSGKDAVEKAGSAGIDLILMDIDMGEGKMDGTETASIILQNHDVPVVFLSSHTEPEVMARTEKITSYGYIVKGSADTVFLASVKMAFKLHKAHKELKEQEEKYRSLVDCLPDVVMRFDRDGRHLFVSENVSEVVDFRAAQFIGKTHREMGFPEAQCRFWEGAIRRVFESGVPFETEYSFESKNGPVIHNWRLMLERDAQGSVRSVLSLSRDITAHRKAEQDYQTLFHEMLDGFSLHEIICDKQGSPVDYRFLAVNPAFERMTGLKADNIEGRTVLEALPGIEQYWIETYGRVALTGEPASFENYSKDLAKYFEVKTFRPAPNQFACFFYDITERKEGELIHLATIELLHMINAASSKEQLIKSVTVFLKQWLCCDAIGIRLKDGDDFPYYETSGFPEEFVQAERHLCSYDAKGEVIRDSTGSPLLDCMCGNILCGRFDPAKDFFTPHGSFWSNCTTELLASTTEADRQARTRNRCNGEGYESVGLFPLRSGNETFGLLQVNSKQKGLFTLKILSSLEWFVDNLAIALARLRAEEELREKREILSATQRLAKVGGWQWDVATQTMSWTEETYRIHDLEEDRFIPGSPEHIDRSLECYAPEHRPLIMAAFKNCVEHGQSYDLESPFVSFKGRRLWVRTAAEALLDKGRIVKVVGNIMDITDHKRAEDRIETLLSEKELLLREVHHRIKNNMHVIMNVLSLQANALEDSSVVAALEDSRSRVQNMMVLYDKLYQSADFRKISAKEYLDTLVKEIIGNFSDRKSITIETQIDDFILDAKILSPVGMILNELLTNTLKHAFVGRENGKMSVFFLTNNNHATFIVQDNGIGIPESTDIASPAGFGMQLVGILTEQLGGTIRIERENGTRFVLEFEV
jgi:PAS domain S-box-containing protein